MSDPAELDKQAEELLAPIPGDSPTGQNARFDPRYEAVLAEVAKLDSPSGLPPNWKLVASNTTELLTTTSKDLLTAAHLAHALQETRGLAGVHVGVLVLTGLIDRYWDKAFPELKRMRGRASALAWFLERTAPWVEKAKVTAADRALVAASKQATSKLSALVAEKMGNDAPAMRPLATAYERLELALPAEAPPPPPPPPEAARPAPVATPEPTPVATQAPAPAPAVAAPTLAAGQDHTTFLRNFGTSLAQAASEIRKADATAAVAYRSLRTGLWLHMVNAPPMSGGKSQVPAPPTGLRTQLVLMAANQKWPELLAECEGAFTQHRMWLDLHRLSAQALAGQGDGFAAARRAVVEEVAAFLRRIPDMRSLVLVDGTPSADAGTQAWLDSEVLVGSGNGKAAALAEDDRIGEALVAARKLVSGGKLADGVAHLQKLVLDSAPGQARFRSRLALAKVLAEGAQLDVARAHYVALDEDIRRYGLEEWDPLLAAECVSGHLQCARALVKAGRLTGQEPAVLYDRLCRLDPVTALRGG